MTLPAGVTEIGDAAFAGCFHLRKLILPAGVAAISAGAFAGVQEIVSESAKFPVDGSGILLDAEEKRILYAPPGFPEIIHGVLTGQLDQIGVEKCKQPFPILWDEQKKFFGIE